MAKKVEVPVWERFTITIEEAAQYFGIGTSKLRELSNEDNCPFVLWVGSKRLIKRQKLEEFLLGLKSILEGYYGDKDEIKGSTGR